MSDINEIECALAEIGKNVEQLKEEKERRSISYASGNISANDMKNPELENMVYPMIDNFLGSCQTTIKAEELLKNFTILIFVTKLFSSSFVGCAAIHPKKGKLYTATIYTLEESSIQQKLITEKILTELEHFATEQQIYLCCRIYHDLSLQICKWRILNSECSAIPTPTTIQSFDLKVSSQKVSRTNMLLFPNTFENTNKVVLLLRGNEEATFNSGVVVDMMLLNKAFKNKDYSSTYQFKTNNTTFEQLADTIDWAEFQRVETMIIYYSGHGFNNSNYEDNCSGSKFPSFAMKDGPVCLEKVYKYCLGKFKLLVVGADTSNMELTDNEDEEWFPKSNGEAQEKEIPYQRLLKGEGSFIFASSEPGEYSFGNKYGGCFTRELLQVAINKKTINWECLLQTVKENLAQREFVSGENKQTGMNVIFRFGTNVG